MFTAACDDWRLLDDTCCMPDGADFSELPGPDLVTSPCEGVGCSTWSWAFGDRFSMLQ